ncbi:MAG: class I SAM-dependent methyltransferase [Candidatus Thermoplasmatota archaeon]
MPHHIVPTSHAAQAGRGFAACDERGHECPEISRAASTARADYDAISQYFDEVRGEELHPWVEKVFELLEGVRGGVVCDIGCGTGRYTAALASKGIEVIGVDLSKGMLVRAGQRLSGGWVRGDAHRLPVKNSTLDAALLMLVLQHLRDWRAAIQEAHRALKDCAPLLIVTVGHGRIRRHIGRFFPGFVEMDIARFPEIPRVKTAMRCAGFEGVRHQRVMDRRGTISMNDAVERFRRKYVSTLSLVPDQEFEQRMAIFEQRLRRRYAAAVPADVELTFVWGIKGRAHDR